MSLSVDDIILYIENTKDATRKLLELINEFGKFAGYKINTQKSLAFLYTNNEISQREIKEIIQFTITSKITKYIGINLPKEGKDLYSENYKILMKTRYLKLRNLVLFYAQKDAKSGLIEIIPLICTSAIWGQYPVFSYSEYPQGATLWGGVSSVADGLMVGILFLS